MKNVMNISGSLGKLIIFSIINLFITSSIFPIEAVSLKDNSSMPTKTDEYHYYTYNEMTDLFHDLKKNHSDIMSLNSIGKSYEGREIWVVKLSDNVNENEDEPGILLMGAHHGNEKPSFEVLINLIKHTIEFYEKKNTDDDNDGVINEDIIDGFDNDKDGLIDEDPSEDRIREVVNNTQIFLIPMVNPDGVEANSRKNCAPNYGPFGFNKKITSYGVNLNRNYGYKWYLYLILPFNYYFFINSMDTSFNYRGERPFSENETRAVRDFVKTKNICISLSYHSYGEIIFYPWMYTSRKTPDEDLYISIGENITKINKYYLLKGRDYKIPRYGGTLGTSEDWLYGKRKIISYTVELCKSRAPRNPDVVFEVSLKHIGVNLYICERSWNMENEKTSIS